MKDITDLLVIDFMAEPVISIEAVAPLADAIRVLDEHRLSVLPVVNQVNNVVGILSTTDLIGIYYEIQTDLSGLKQAELKIRNFLIELLSSHGDDTSVRDVMTSPVETVSASTNLVTAAQILDVKQYHHLPVVDDHNHPIGMLSTTDFLRAFANHGAMLFR